MGRQRTSNKKKSQYNERSLRYNEGTPSKGFKSFVGSILLLLGGAIILSAVTSFSAFDSSSDTAGIGPINNSMGLVGAYTANFLLQIFGNSIILGSILIIFSGMKSFYYLAIKKGASEVNHKFFMWLGIIVFSASTLSALPIPHDWPLATGLGGILGDKIYLNSIAGLNKLNVPLPSLIVTLITFTVTLLLLVRFLEIVKKDMFDILHSAFFLWSYLRSATLHVSKFIKGVFGKHKVSNTESEIVEKVQRVTKVKEKIPKVAKSESSLAKPKIKRKKTPSNEFYFPEGSEFVLPGLDLLKNPPPRSTVQDAGALSKASDKLHKVMADYGIEGDMGAVRPGPVVTLFEFEPAPGVKSQRVINLSDDIARNMSSQSARIAVVPGRNAMGVEMPNRRRETVWLRDMLNSELFKNTDMALPLILGEDIGGAPFITDLSKMPHLLIAGTTGSGKSVGVNAMILSLMYTLTPDQCKFIMIDPKMLELSVYDGAPHLLAPVVTEPKKAVVALKWTVREMEDRYRKMSKMGVRNMAGYNEKVAEAKSKGEPMSRKVMTGYNKETGDPEFETEELNFKPMPFIVVIIDEMADLMMVAKKDIEGSVQRLAQMARAAGIHMIMATQRPSVDVITGTIKANFPTRISFRVGSKIDSRTILGEQGAEQLLGNGDMLFMGTGRPRRFHGPFVSDGEVEKIANFVKAQGSPSYTEDITTEREDMASDSVTNNGETGGNTLFDQAVAIVSRDRKASTSYIQRKLSIGYNRAADLIERMESDGMIGPSGAGGKREIFLPESNDSY